jgi:hypothetical protein
MSFKLLYQEGLTQGHHLAIVAIYVDNFAKGLGLKQLNVDPAAFNQVAAALMRPDFPHVDGLQKASPFKKAANFFVWFVASKPIVDPLPLSIITPDLQKIENHQNVILAYHMAVDCLHNAELHKVNVKGSEVVKLERKIRVSNHFFQDFVEAYSAATPSNDFKSVCLMFEQLAYKYNPKAPYSEVI